jgi:hypothetical protein
MRLWMRKVAGKGNKKRSASAIVIPSSDSQLGELGEASGELEASWRCAHANWSSRGSQLQSIGGLSCHSWNKGSTFVRGV